MIKLGDEFLDLTATAINGPDGKYAAAMLSWSVVTEKLARKRNRRASRR